MNEPASSTVIAIFAYCNGLMLAAGLAQLGYLAQLARASNCTADATAFALRDR
ncbi:hypothetical protein [Congregibacter sp.]|uniref:hypothetical protein n=1 Tax=Congregibacter sp. TaxID=2744308 RepID=UPI003F6C6F4D